MTPHPKGELFLNQISPSTSPSGRSQPGGGVFRYPSAHASRFPPAWLHRPRPPLIEIPSALAFRSIVLTDVLNLAAISDAVAPFAAIAISSRSFFRVNRPGLRLPTIPTISSPSARAPARSRQAGGSPRSGWARRLATRPTCRRFHEVPLKA